MTYRRVGRIAAGIVATAALVAAVAMFGPRPVGPASFVSVTHGSSMQPRFHVGDLAVVHKTEAYRTGDIIAFHGDYDHVVLHRIIGINGDRFVTRGDNNGFTDAYQPSRSDVVGELWWSVPKAGAFFAWIGQPRTAAMLGGIVALILATGFGAQRRRRRRRSDPRKDRVRDERVRKERPHRARSAFPAAATFAAAFGVLALSFGALGAVAYARPLRTAGAVGYHQQGTFSYRAPAPSTAVYGGRAGETGQPVFFNVSGAVGVGYTYAFATDAPHAVTGTANLTAILSASDGWKRSWPISRSSFSGDKFVLGGSVDLGRVRAVIAGLEKATGVVAGAYSLDVVSAIDVRGIVATLPVKEAFRSSLRFHVDAFQMQIDQAPADGASPFAKGSDGTVSVAAMHAGVLRVWKIHLPVGVARRVGLAGSAAAGGLALIALAFFALRGRGDEVARIEQRYGHLLIAVTCAPADGAVDVESFADLVRLAEHAEEPVLFERRRRAFWLRDRDIAYRYRAPGGDTGYLPYEEPLIENRDVVPMWAAEELRRRASS